MSINCLHPRFIFHPHSLTLCARYQNIVTPQGIIHSKSCPYVKLSELSEESANGYQILNPDTGQLFPMFLQVACNKCILCRHKKINQWSYRCICETRENGMPYFVTLTYSEDARPSEGVLKSDVQKFMKRLRTNLSRKLGVDTPLRYLATAEYTHSITRRPHYHLLVWGIPHKLFPTQYKILKWIEQNWTQPTGRYLSDGSPEMSSNGFCYVLPTSKGGINYVVKYMSKQSDVPKGQNPVFRLNSQGLGRDYINKHLSSYAEPSNLYENCYDIINSKSVTRPFTTYTKNKLYPSESMTQSPFFWKYIKKSIAAYNYAYKLYRMLPPELHHLRFRFPRDVQYTFRMLRPYHVYSIHFMDDDVQKLFPFSKTGFTDDCFLDDINEVLHYAYAMYKNAMYDFDIEKHNKFLASFPARDIRSFMLSRFFGSLDYNVSLNKYKAEKIENNYIRKEKVR